MYLFVDLGRFKIETLEFVQIQKGFMKTFIITYIIYIFQILYFVTCFRFEIDC